MKTLSDKDIGKDFCHPQTGQRMLLVSIPKREKLNAAKCGIFRYVDLATQDHTESTFSAEDVELWTGKATLNLLTQKPCHEMTMRELVATNVLQGIIANRVLTNDSAKSADLVKQAIGLTDELIKQLSSLS